MGKSFLKSITLNLNKKLLQEVTKQRHGGGRQVRRNFRRYRADKKLLWNRKGWDCLGNRTKKRERILQRGGPSIQKFLLFWRSK